MSSSRIVSVQHPDGSLEAGVYDRARPHEVTVVSGGEGFATVYGVRSVKVHYDGGKAAICGRASAPAPRRGDGGAARRRYKDSRRC